ncbi:MAG: hypothetical protein ACKVVP_23230 [Chloroflexota bacterium]
MLHRTQLLLEPAQHDALCEIARQDGRSISDIVRGLVQKEIERRRAERSLSRARGLEALRQIREISAATFAESGGQYNAVEELNTMRDERDEEIWRAVHDRG